LLKPGCDQRRRIAAKPPVEERRMGQDIQTVAFSAADFERFGERLHAETAKLVALIKQGALSQRAPVAGLELEAWLVDESGRPAPRNEEFLARLGAPEVVTELAQFNIELNVPPRPLAGDGLALLAGDLQATWDRCREVARSMDLQVVSIGILPTLTDAQLSLHNISNRPRYHALNEQVHRQRKGRPLRLDIEGTDGQHLLTEHHDVMLEAGATSLQAHLQVTPEHAARAYNASLIASAPTVAVAANSPYLFGQALWHETRIALFEQSLAIGTRARTDHPRLMRVTFGSGFVRSLAECFGENDELFPVLLPITADESPARFAHLRLHNGTIWRWNRPLIGFDDDGTPHLRIEHRPMSAGPTIADMMANLAFYYGLTACLIDSPTPPEDLLPFADARDNLYAAARFGLAAEARWLDGDAVRIGELVVDTLIDHARLGLARLGVDATLARDGLAIVEARAECGQTGAVWQRRFITANGPDFARLTREYALRQAEGAPVHLWDLRSRT
jgi:gamma-glutamyl:cysteine ligase YbdK (ATP-grasp superfamily)